MITGLHTTYSQGFYKAERNFGLKFSEDIDLATGRDLRALGPRFDGKDSVYIGYGYDLLDLGKTVQQIKNDLNAVGVTLSQHDETWLTDYRNGSPTVTRAFLVQQAQANAFTTNLGSEPVAAALLTNVLDDKYEVIVTNRLAQFSVVLPDSRERAALVSLTYANPSLLGNKLMQAIAGGNRADAWFEIRYQSNAEPPSTAGGTATRRFYESELFGLYGDGVTAGNIDDQAAKDVFRMYTSNRDIITAYEAKYGAGGSMGDRVAEASARYGLTVGYWTQESQIARTFLISTYAEGRTIDGEVLVGQDEVFPGDILQGTSNGDLLFGEKGNDVLYGGEGIDTLSGGADADLLRGGAGDDSLQGGVGDDRLEGGAGLDSYYWKKGDGHDRIEDSDADGVIFVNGQMLVGGVKKSGHTDWVSSDGTIKYRMLGTDLVVELNGTTIMTVNENFQSGQFGIRLIDGMGSGGLDMHASSSAWQHMVGCL